MPAFGPAREKAQALNKIALPLIIQNLSTTAILLADVAIIGRLSHEAFNAVGVVSALFSLIVGIVGYLSVQFNISGGQSICQGQPRLYRRVCRRFNFERCRGAGALSFDAVF